jgi:hypothetical protein
MYIGVTYHDIDTIFFKVSNLVTESEGKLLGLNRLVNVVTRERPSKASNRAGKHALHRLARD